MALGARAIPDRTALAAWLVSPDVVSADGTVRSWSNPRHPGFAYPEAAALWALWVAWRSGRGEPAPGADLLQRVTNRLEADLLTGPGLGKDGAVYLFDTCLGVAALLRVGALGLARRPSPTTRRAWQRTLEQQVDAEAPVWPRPNGPTRWSQGWGAHLSRAAALLETAAAAAGEAPFQGLAARLAARLQAGRDAPQPYLHARLYALEGALIQAPSTSAGDAEARRLVALQHAEGGLPAFADAAAPLRADATAQAVRVWAASHRTGFAEPIRRGLSFLAGLQGVEGAIRYQPDSDDRNTWASLFTDQAVAWAVAGPDTWGWV